MSNLENVFSSFQVGDGEQALWDKLCSMSASNYGITSVLYGFAHSKYVEFRGGLTKCLYLKHNHPSDYINYVGEDTFLDNDECADAIIKHAKPFLWADNLENATDAQRRQALVDHEFRMDVGVSFSLPFFGGAGMGGLGMCARGMKATEFEKIWTEKSREMCALVAAFDACMRPVMISNRLRLTPRERDVIAYAAAGMGGKEIATRLGLHPKTVFNTMERARHSLQANNTMEAIAKAYVYNLI